MGRVEKIHKPDKIAYGDHENQYFLYYEPKDLKSDKLIVWVHGGGWNSGSAQYFDFVGQSIAGHGYPVISIGYRLSTQIKYPGQIEDVCVGYRAALDYLDEKGLDRSRLVVSGPSAGAHLTALLCYSRTIQDRYGVDVSGIIGYIGVGGPYSFSAKSSPVLAMLLKQLFNKGYDRSLGEPCSQLGESRIPMLLIQSEHDGVVGYGCAEEFYQKAKDLGIACELYPVPDRRNTHSWYTAGMFLERRETYRTLDKFFRWIEAL